MAKPESEQTQYLVLRSAEVEAEAGATTPWEPIGVAVGHTFRDAMRDACERAGAERVAERLIVAVPVSSWRPQKAEVETRTEINFIASEPNLRAGRE